MRVLLIDDDQNLFEKRLKSLPGVDLVVSDDGDFLKMIELARDPVIDVILMDGDLDWWGGGCGGRWGEFWVRELRTKGVKTRIVMFSSSDQYNEMGVRAGADAVWSKDGLHRPGWAEGFMAVLTGA